ncbi:MAG: hypothetical protein ACKO9H_13765, partial [Planctomycetota bacterium]
PSAVEEMVRNLTAFSHDPWHVALARGTGRMCGASVTRYAQSVRANALRRDASPCGIRRRKLPE